MPSVYCTLEQLKARLGLHDTRKDEELEQIIEATSRMIDAECGTRFYVAAEPETRYFTTSHFHDVLVDDVISVAEVVTDSGDGTWSTTWLVTDYVLAPYNAAAEGRPYWKIERALGGEQMFSTWTRGVRVTGAWGYSTTVPAIVEAVCLREALYQSQANTTPYGMTAGDGAVAAPPSIAMSRQSRLMLAPFRRMVLA
jgi:hypothetical protein